MPDDDDVVHHPEGVTDKDLAYQSKVQERIKTGQDPTKPSLVVSFANTLQELGVKYTYAASGGLRWTCGCEVVFGGVGSAMIQVCEAHR